MVVPAEVDGELAEEFSGDGVDDAYVEVVDEQDDVGSGVGSGVGSSDAEVVGPAGRAQGDAAGLVDDVVPDPVMFLVVTRGSGDGLGHRAVERRWMTGRACDMSHGGGRVS